MCCNLARNAALIVFVVFPSLASPQTADAETSEMGRAARQRELLVYFANETRPDIVGSDNYLLLFEALDASETSFAESLRASILRDAREFPKYVAEDRVAIVAAARRYGFDAALFTNMSVREGVYRYVDGRAGSVQDRPFPKLPKSENVLLTESPLARPEALAAALSEAAKIIGDSGRSVVLITKSHGHQSMAVMPRVLLDMTKATKKEVVATIRNPPAPGSDPPHWSKPVGITKTRYWEIIRQASELNLRFSLIFREACGSGVASLEEGWQVPAEIGAVAHSGTRNIKYGEIDYADLFSDLESDRSLSEHLKKRLRALNLHVRVPSEIFRERLVVLAALWWPVTLFLPLIAWLAWFFWPSLTRPHSTHLQLIRIGRARSTYSHAEANSRREQ